MVWLQCKRFLPDGLHKLARPDPPRRAFFFAPASARQLVAVVLAPQEFDLVGGKVDRRTDMAKYEMRAIQRIALIYGGAVCVGYVLSLMRVPLPWMIGPMIFAGVVGVLGTPLRVPHITRPIGQTVVAGSVGLSFTPIALAAIGEQIVPMLAAALMTILSGFLVAAILMRLTRLDVISASLASIPGGPVEMAALATSHGADAGLVAFAQTLRIAFLVLVIPPLLVGLDGTGQDPSRVFTGGETDPAGALLLLALAAVGGLFFRLVRVSSPFFLGPLGFSALASAMALPVSAVPFPVLAGAQVLLGVWLGAMFDKDLMTRSRSFVPAAFLSTALLLILCAAMAFGISAVTGISWRTMVLATAPGSVTEMALTAQILHEGVALVAAFHVVRIFVILPSAPLIFAIVAKLAYRFGKE
jgi:membrane AbrB-like protein